MKISLRGVKVYCNECGRSTWMYKRMSGKWVCRGDYPPSKMSEYAAEGSKLWPGCQKEIDGRTN